MPFYRCVPPSSGGGGGGGGDLESGSDILLYDSNNEPHPIPLAAYFTQDMLSSSINAAFFYNDLIDLVNNGCENATKMYFGDMLVGITNNFTTFSRVCNNFNGPIIFGNSMQSGFTQFSNSAFNNRIEIHYNGTRVNSASTLYDLCNMQQAFLNATYFNSTITFTEENNPNVKFSLNMMFSNCFAFNQPFNIPMGCDIMSYLFRNCTNFNSRVLIKRDKLNPTVYNAHYIFQNCFVFNQPIAIPKGANFSGSPGYFFECRNLNQPVAICCSDFQTLMGTTGIQLIYMFRNCSAMASNIILFGNNFNSSNVLNSYMMLNGKDNAKRVNIYCPNPVINTGIVNNTKSGVTGVPMTWTATTNGFYNAAYNIYILNNWQDALNDFNSYYYNFYGEYPDFGE